ncbi:unnamed protein product [Boreogadus saida]
MGAHRHYRSSGLPRCSARGAEHRYDFVDQRTSSSGGGNSALVLQLSSGSAIPFSGAELTPPDLPPEVGRRRHGVERVLLEQSCRTAAELPRPELLVRPWC